MNDWRTMYCNGGRWSYEDERLQWVVYNIRFVIQRSVEPRYHDLASGCSWRGRQRNSQACRVRYPEIFKKRMQMCTAMMSADMEPKASGYLGPPRRAVNYPIARQSMIDNHH